MQSFIAHFYFSPRGRTGRQAYWLFGVVPFFVLGFILGLTASNFRPSPRNLLIALVVVTLIGLWIWIALGSRRLHDIGISAWWMILVIVLPVVIGLQLPQYLAQLPAILVTIALGTPRGVSGSNRFGPDPLARPNS